MATGSKYSFTPILEALTQRMWAASNSQKNGENERWTYEKTIEKFTGRIWIL